MALSITSRKKNKGPASGADAHGKTTDANVSSLVFVEEGDHLYGIYGVNAAGGQVELGDVAKLSASSSDVTKLDAQLVDAHRFKAVPLGVGNANAVIKVTFSGSLGLQTVTVPFSVTGNPATGLVATQSGTITVA